jgi:hypothetical protein
LEATKFGECPLSINLQSNKVIVIGQFFQSKTRRFSFGGKVLMDKKAPPLFLGQFSFRSIIFFVFVFSFSLFQQIGPENTVEGV